MFIFCLSSFLVHTWEGHLEAFYNIYVRYKLRIFRAPIDGPPNVLSDNLAVIQNVTIPSPTIKKRNNAISVTMKFMKW